MTDNMRIWNAVEKTDPAHTKHVNQRGGFTAIAAASQIMAATRQFGPIGEGWGYTVESTDISGAFFISHVSMWHGDRGNVFGPMPGCAEMFGGRPDSDAPKKATTDAITKLLSQLGFNADVFLGKYDDNKYVEERKNEATAVETRDRIKTAITRAETQRKLHDLWGHKATVAAFATLPQPMQFELQTAYTDRMAALPDDPTVKVA